MGLRSRVDEMHGKETMASTRRRVEKAGVYVQGCRCGRGACRARGTHMSDTISLSVLLSL